MHEQHKNLIEKIKEVLPKEREMPRNEYGIPYDSNEKGYNQAFKEVKEIYLPQVLEVTKNYLLDNMSSDHSNCPIKETCIGYQSAISDIITLLSGEESKE